MRKIIGIFLISAALMLALTINAQTPQALKYQTVVRDAAGDIIQNQNVSFRFKVHDGSASGTIVYSETHSINTNSFGLATLEIGNGTPFTGQFSGIDWGANTKFLEVELDPAGGNNFTSMGTSQILSVPYALYSETSGNWEQSDNYTYNLNDSIGIGTATPGARLDIDGHIWQTGTGFSVFLGEGAGENDDLMYHANVFVGFNSGNQNTEGGYNTALGGNSLSSNISGKNNTATGYVALGANTIGGGNTANGYLALSANTEGNSNTSTGIRSLAANTTGSDNTAGGNYALYKNTTADCNSAYGSKALYSNTTGFSNVAVGVRALYKNKYNNNLIAIGDSALFNNGYGLPAGSIFGSYNTAIGSKALYLNIGGYSNLAFGYMALYSNDYGANNIAGGHQALYSNTSGSGNLAFGSLALYANSTGEFNSAIGFRALSANTTGYSNVAMGVKALMGNTTRSNIVAVGDSTLYYNGIGATYWFEGTKNTAVGSKALYSNSTGYSNTAIGYNALYSNTSGGDNTANGEYALFSNEDGYDNVATGIQALYSNTSGTANVAIGYESLSNNVTGDNNTAIGGYAYLSNDFTNSTALGYSSVITGSNQVFLGNSTVTDIGGFAAWTNVSDARFKTNVKENVKGLTFIMKLRPVTYNLDMEAIAVFLKIPDSLRLPNSESIKAAEIQTGFIAQEVEAAAAESGFNFHGIDKPKNKNDYYGLRYAEFVVPLVKAVQEQEEKISKLENENTGLKQQLNELLNRIEKLESR